MLNKSIGISLGYNTSVAVVGPMGVELAISEERLNGEKNTKKFPRQALQRCMEYLSPSAGEDVHIGICSYENINDRTMRYFDTDGLYMRNAFQDFNAFLKAYIQKICHIENEVIIKRVEHHDAHRLPAIYMSGFLLDNDKTIAISADGFGDGTSATIYDCSSDTVLAKENLSTSLGLVYQFVTGALGYKEHQHEGKITGLAAYGSPIYTDIFMSKIIGYNHKMKCFSPNYRSNLFVPVNEIVGEVEPNENIQEFDELLKLKAHVYFLIKFLKEKMGAKDEDIASSVQDFTEKMMVSWVSDIFKVNDINSCNVVLSGGLFANVKVNFKIKSIDKVKNLFVLPPMGDEGTSIGAGIRDIINRFGKDVIDIESFGKDCLYLGRIKSPPKAYILDPRKYSTMKIDDIGSEKTVARDEIPYIIAEYLSRKKIVCVSIGHSEFGPRALGNHSILYDAGQKETNDSLNKRLSRTEFMPFAPITIDKFKDDLFLNTQGLEKSLKYMTIAVPVTSEFRQHYKAAYHIDFTARPQILSEPDNPIIYKAIEIYSKQTEKKALINTSFNLHNSPIIYNNITALESFEKADLDVLVLDGLLVIKRGV